VALKEDDWCLSSTEAALRQSAPKLAYFVPDFQNPTGLRLSAAGREQLAGSLRRTRTLAVADETLVELALDSADGPPPMAAFAEDFVITIGSASKSFWGGLRLGWIRASADLVDTIVTNRSAVDLGAALFEQLVLTELLAEPESVLAPQRAAIRERRDVLAAGLAEHCPQWSFRLPGGGLSLWCELDGPISTRLAVAAEGYGLRLAPGSRFGAHGGLERWLRVPFSLPPDTLRAAAAGLGRLAAAVGGATPRSTGMPVAVS
jgi:DNA-binding transcriptional MocR family regulator